MEKNKTISNLSALGKNPKSRIIIVATVVIIGGALIVGNMNKDVKAQRPADLRASVNIGSAPSVKSVPGTSDSIAHNELIEEKNKQDAQKAIESGGSAIPRLVNQIDKGQQDPFELIKQASEKQAKEQQSADAKIPAPAIPAPVAPPPIAPPQQSAPAKPVKSAELLAKEENMRAMIGGMLETWKPAGQKIEFDYTSGKPAVSSQSPAQVAASSSASGSAASAGSQQQASEANVKAGSILSAIMLTSVNSDEPGPILAQIVSGPYSGSRVMGQFTRPANSEKMVLQFNTISIPGAAKSYSINAFAVDPQSARTALGTGVDHHYLYRYGSLFAGSFISGYSKAIAQSGAEQTTSLGPNGVETTTKYPTLNEKEKALIALGEFGGAVSSAVSSNFTRPITVTLDSGTSMGLLFMGDATFK